ncbi:hypothetical protein R3P38DRAFT_3134108 [Favolaschia claudopus]|uniref:Uncharacterized protein n=1 Tax=Favolaschia claudopus TaxID=2862362 RepID=A0AAV9Z7V3_9AGAR
MVLFSINFAVAFIVAFSAFDDISAITLKSLHPNAHAYGLEPDWTIAYDRNSTELARYHTPGNLVDAAVERPALGGKCTALAVHELTSLPGWPTIAQDIRNHFGDTTYNLWTTWDGVTHAHSCVGDTIVSLVPTGTRQCTLNNITTDGVLVGTSGTTSITISSGFAATAGETVTKQSTLSGSYTASIVVGVPDIFSVGASYTIGVQFTNTYGSSFETKVNNQIMNTITIDSRAGKTCHLSLVSENCFQSSKGTVPFTAMGEFRIGFNSRVMGHYYWGWGLRDYTIEDRSSYAEFTGSINAHSKGKYRGVCD